MKLATLCNCGHERAEGSRLVTVRQFGPTGPDGLKEVQITNVDVGPDNLLAFTAIGGTDQQTIGRRMAARADPLLCWTAGGGAKGPRRDTAASPRIVPAGRLCPGCRPVAGAHPPS